MINYTGIHPTKYTVLIKVDELDDKSAGGIFIPEHTLEREQMAHDRGVLFEAGGNCFENPEWKGTVPFPGNHVIFNKYAGALIKWRSENGDLERFRLCNDEEIKAVFEE